VILIKRRVFLGQWFDTLSSSVLGTANLGMHPVMNHEVAAPSKRQERKSQEVWDSNFEEEIIRMRDVAEQFQHVSMDTQFPGLVARPTGPFCDYEEFNYMTLKCNVDLTRVIQVGLTFSDAKGNRPKGISTWRFNFEFNAQKDVFSQDSIDGLRQNRGLDLGKHHGQGIDTAKFGELLMGSGLVLNEEIRWLTFCGASSFQERLPDEEAEWVAFSGMYDFGHLLRLLTALPLPDEVNGFYELLDLFFPCRCDIAMHWHRLQPVNGDSMMDTRRRGLSFRNAHHVLEAFFRLPDAIRRTAFDRVERPEKPADANQQKQKRPDREEDRHKERHRNGADRDYHGAHSSAASSSRH